MTMRALLEGGDLEVGRPPSWIYARVRGFMGLRLKELNDPGGFTDEVDDPGRPPRESK